MKDVHPYPQDITADPFFVFGGLFSRKVIAETIEAMSFNRPIILTQIIDLADRCSSEHALQQGIEDTFTDSGLQCRKPHTGEPRCDRILGADILVEIKLDNHKFDPQFWHGSKENENAVEQTRGYLDESSSKKWALLTNGKVIRFMHKDHGFNYLDFWLCDSNRKGETKHATLIEKILREPEFAERLLKQTLDERARFNTSFEDRVQNFWDKYQSDVRMWNVALVETVLLTAFYRYLEDCGILPILAPDYQAYRLNRPKTKNDLFSSFNELRKQTFLTKKKVPEIKSLIGDPTLQRINDVLSKSEVLKDFQKLFWDEAGAVDLSDLGVSFFGDAYQLFANKTDINGVDGQYFTGSDLAKEAAVYFVEDENRGIAKGEIIYDPFVGSGQLLRALVPFFHILTQAEAREPSIIGGMRTIVERMAGTDIDENACWLARLSLTIATSERGSPLIDLKEQIRHADVFETCFGFTESRWQEALGIKGEIRGIITNPPWRRLRQTSNELYTLETGEIAPLKKNKENWRKYQSWLKDGGRDRSTIKANELKTLSKKHRETFASAGQREVNVAISAVDFINRINGVTRKKWVAFLPDCFFVGQNKLRSQPNLVIRSYYSYPYNEHFKDTDSVMKFGVVFGGGSPRPTIYCHPMGRGKVNVLPVFKRLDVLPIYASTEEAYTQAVWFEKAIETKKWRRGEFDETEAPKKGAHESQNGVPVRGAKKCNDNISHSCIFNKESLSYWNDWKSSIKGARVIVRDNRSNTKTQKIQWAGTHIPGTGGIPKKCSLSNAWNYLLATSTEVKALGLLLNSPIADTAMRSIGSKRHINPKDLNKLGLPPLTPEVQALINSAKDFPTQSAVILVHVFELSRADAEKVLKSCKWVSKTEREAILGMYSLDLRSEAEKLHRAVPKKRNAVLKRIAKTMGRR